MKYFGQEKLLSRMLSDMRDVEGNGLVTSSGHTINTSVLCIVGDNLGSQLVVMLKMSVLPLTFVGTA